MKNLNEQTYKEVFDLLINFGPLEPKEHPTEKHVQALQKKYGIPRDIALKWISRVVMKYNLCVVCKTHTVNGRIEVLNSWYEAGHEQNL